MYMDKLKQAFPNATHQIIKLVSVVGCSHGTPVVSRFSILNRSRNKEEIPDKKAICEGSQYKTIPA